jgi:RecB family endonuclease NucS
MNTKELVDRFLAQSIKGDLHTSSYPKEWNGFKTKVSFGMGAISRVPWIAFTAADITVSNGYYPVYLFFKDLKVLILAYGISETNEFEESWPLDITNNTETIKSYLNKSVPRYGDSYVFKAYSLSNDNKIIEDYNSKKQITEKELESDLDIILKQYQQITSTELINPNSNLSQGVFYLEKQLEDFIIQNWDHTDLGKKYDLIIEEGVLLSQQYRTDIGPMDILAKDKKTGSYVVIELKKNQTSDDTIGQVARYMGWVEEKLKDKNVKGIIIAHSFDKKLEYALKRINNVEVYIYEVDFRLKEFKGY